MNVETTMRELFAMAKDLSQPENPQQSSNGASTDSSRVISLVWADTIEPKEQKFLVYPYIPIGEATWFEGAPRSGKTFAAIDIISRVTRGEPFVNGEPIKQGRVAILSSEDSIDTTLVPRLIADKADLSCVSFITAKVGDEEAEIAFLQDLVAIEKRLRDEDISLVFVDGVFKFLGVRDSSSYTEAYAAMCPFIAMLRRLGIGAIIVRHTRKTGGAALDAGLGSTGYTALGRSTCTVAMDKADKENRLFTHAGVTGAPTGDSYQFRIGEVTLSGFERSTGFLVWGNKTDVTADEALAQVPTMSHEDRNLAEEILLMTLVEPMPARDIYTRTKEQGVSDRTLRRAATRLGVHIERRGFGEGSVWYPPGWTKEERSGHSGHSGRIGHSPPPHGRSVPNVPNGPDLPLLEHSSEIDEETEECLTLAVDDDMDRC
jgi:hypothetical protein